MSSLRKTAELLTASSTLRGAERFAARLGFSDPLPLELGDRERLGIADFARRAFVANGPGLLRCCIVPAARGQVARHIAAQCASRLGNRAPHALWLVMVAQPTNHTLIIAIPPQSGSGRVTALVVDTKRVLDSDAETAAAMVDAAAASDSLTHHRWREIMGRDALTRRFYRELESAVGDMASSARGPAPDDARREMALLTASRLLFLAFLEAKGWLNRDRAFLRNRFDVLCTQGGGAHHRLLAPLFFGTLNTPVNRRSASASAFGRVPFLNGGLFARTALEKRWRSTTFTDEAIGRVVCDLLGRFRVTAREESVSWSEAAVDPEMLGRAFESLMASDDRRRSGAFYTPLPIIERVTSAGLDRCLAGMGISDTPRRLALNREPIPVADRRPLLAAVTALRVIDPACGSGAFLVHLLERLADIRGLAGDLRSTSTRRRDVLTGSIFGVDVNPMAVWLCELRLWLSVVIDAEETDGIGVAPLPNLDHHIRVGDALSGPGFDEAAPVGITDLSLLRRRYANATGARKRTIGRSLDATERRIAVQHLRGRMHLLDAKRRELLVALRGRDLFDRRVAPSAAQRIQLTSLRQAAREARRREASLRSGGALPFSFPIQFADATPRSGFDLVLGNPPWVRLHRIGAAARADLANRYRSWRDAAWATGASDAGTGTGFASQVDLAALFAERATQITRPGGVIGLLLPAKLWTSLSAGGIRSVLLDTCRISSLEDWSEAPAAFDAVVYPSMLVATRVTDMTNTGRNPASLRGVVHRKSGSLDWAGEPDRLSLDKSPGAPWLVIPPLVRDAFDLLTARGIRLAQTQIGRPTLGVKTGCNDAFLVTPRPGWRADAKPDDHSCPPANRTWPVRSGDREDDVETSFLRPVLRGENVRPWSTNPIDAAIIWTHDSIGRPVDQLPRGTAGWLAPWRRQLEARTDATRARRYWTLFRTEAADMRRPRVVWSDIGRVPRATVLARGDPTVPLNSCYVLFAPSIDEACAVAALLNSAPVAAWLCALAEPARGGYHRFLGWTLARLPIPVDWGRAVSILAPIGRAALDGAEPDPHSLAIAVARAYRVRLSRLEPLLTWCLR